MIILAILKEACSSSRLEKTGLLTGEYTGRSELDWCYWNEIEILNDTLGLYSNVSQLYWLESMDRSSWYEVCKYNGQYAGTITSKQGLHSDLDNSASSIRMMFTYSSATDYQLSNRQSTRWQSMKNAGYTRLPEFPGIRLIKMEREVYDEWFFDNRFKEETWYDQRGLMMLSQTILYSATADERWVDGGVTMEWKRID